MVDPELLRRSSLFSALTPGQLSRLLEAARETDHPEGDTLTDQGAIGYRFFLLLDGAATVERDGALVAEIGSGDFVGEIGLLGGGAATATVRCTKPTRCLTILREDFWAALEAEPGIALRILEVVCRRLESEWRLDASSNLA